MAEQIDDVVVEAVRVHHSIGLVQHQITHLQISSLSIFTTPYIHFCRVRVNVSANRIDCLTFSRVMIPSLTKWANLPSVPTMMEAPLPRFCFCMATDVPP